MKWATAWLLQACLAWGFSTQRKHLLRDLVRETWNNAFDAYMVHAFPHDELLPLSCQGQSHDAAHPENWATNDVCANVALTLVDVMDSFVVMNNHTGFQEAVRQVISHVSFDQDVKVQVFEINIRVLGGLLSAHIFASEPKHGFVVDWYQGELLVLARDLARRLLPAFVQSRTGLPHPRVNLRHGIVMGETYETCAAAVGSLYIEFATLSKLTGEPIYERYGLVGNTIDMNTGKWIYPVSGVGAGIDSLFEYMIKNYVLFGEMEFFRVWQDAYGALMEHSRSSDGFWDDAAQFRGVNMDNGIISHHNIDSLSAFWPGVQVLAGDVEGAIKSHSVYANLWMRYSGLPEIFTMSSREAQVAAYPLRPELIESTLYLYQATGDDAYLHFGERMVRDIVNRTVTPCGLAGIDNLETGALDNRMHSFALSETLKYAYLIFDDTNIYNYDDSNAVFNTEGHLMPVHHRYLASHTRSVTTQTDLICPVYDPSTNGKHWSPMAHGIKHRTDADWARLITGYQLDDQTAQEQGVYSIYGTCEGPAHEDYLLDVIFRGEDATRPPRKIRVVPGGFFVPSIANHPIQLLRKNHPARYDISKIGPFRVPAGSSVYFAESFVFREPEAALPFVRLLLSDADGLLLEVRASTATFGPDVLAETATAPALPISALSPSTNNTEGCRPYSFRYMLTNGAMPERHAVLIQRGTCSFGQKAALAAKAGASLVLVVNSDDMSFTPTADEEEAKAAKIPLLLISRSTGNRLLQMMASGKAYLRVMGAEPSDGLTDKVFVINGLPVSNAKWRKKP